MAILNGYCTLADIKTRLSIPDTNDDTTLESVVQAVSRTIDEYCHRRFWKNGSDETRYFTPRFSDRLTDIGDVVSVTTLTTDDAGARTYTTTWATTDFDLEPSNATLDTRPYTELRVAPQGRYRFPGVTRGAKIVGVFGWPAIPDMIHEACLLQAERVFRRKDAPFGIAGSISELGAMRLFAKLDPDVELMILPHRRVLVG